MNLWFTEDIPIVPGSRLQLQISRTLHTEESQFQKIDILETTHHGRMLLLDGIIMTTEFDEAGYHEMISHVALFAHKNPRRVLVVGGGDGGTVREVLRHPSVEEVHMCEIDRRVVEVCEEHMPALAGRLRDPRVELIYKDGVAWVEDHPDTYDAILVDSTDPVGIAENLFKYPFYESCHKALKEDGILVTQAENPLLHGSIIRDLISHGKKLFPIHRYFYTAVPTYPGGLIGFTFFSRRYDTTEHLEEKLNQPAYGKVLEELRYWTPDHQTSAFVLPAAVRRTIYG